MMYINLDRNSTISLTRQIYSHIREAILNGTLKQFEKLPSTREMSHSLNVARNVVIESYEQLTAEGYIYTKNGAGTYVNDGIYFERTATLSSLINRKAIENRPNKNVISFRTGIPDLASIPIKKWGQLYKSITLSVSPLHMDYQSSKGEYELRYQLSMYLRRARGVNTYPENVLIINGAAQAFSLLSRLVSDDGYALVENPLSYGILHTLESNKVKIKTIPVDEFGMETAKLPNFPPELIFTTPSHQFPTGVILPIKRRIQMIQYARKHNSYIVEDDYDSEFRFDGSPIQSMQSLDPTRVIYVGTFSKTLMPSLRMGYMVLPDALCAQMEETKYVADLHSPILEQLTMAKFIEAGFFDMHIKKMRSIYLKRRNHLIKCLKNAFGDTVSISGAEAGMHLVATFKAINFNNLVMHNIEDNDLQIVPISKHYLLDETNKVLKHPYNDSLIFGYGNTNILSIDAGIKRLYTALSS
ncbi:transcriptional regulator with HTH domain and aminotransferase domain [Desulfosporosinus acidiphilus SJ4]|uniref:Transcriptional regulator with HTH domain and aminotransferase domain n=1 Tax=Desulfosporosinus acidiphilus (strain DSM 22704 / JCM 16185 / SJ4) TaxID=646529 RepID=I4D5M8_DESAJ|nr:PLP-dependent aminotransferase family protein [Desulfosporosinus acidiphilus]AFM41102.1 transcriptional regulator with HTH domain and aminotransferase domain [Desulfosporosinus acidiphilus SJ4]